MWYIPSLLKDMSLQAVESFVWTGSKADSLIVKVPCHCQAAERHVQLVSVASQTVCGVSRRNCFIKIPSHQGKKMSNMKRSMTLNFN